MLNNLINTLDEFESELAHVIGDMPNSSRVNHIICNRISLCSDSVKYNYKASVERGEISEDEADIAIEAMRAFDKIFFSLDDMIGD